MTRRHRHRVPYRLRSQYDAAGLLILAAMLWAIYLLCQLPIK
ncbi:MAG TPA: hypothetical protein VMU04_11380 [Candidatus Acidoferrum sp.]|nr:hypothetical protein [Candidatus Acidoferrum sp.]